MKIKFNKLPAGNGKIKISFDGGNTFTEFNISDIRDVGVPLEDNQDYSKIQIKGKSSILKDLDVVKNITFENKIVIHLLDMTDEGSGDTSFTISKEEYDILNNLILDDRSLYISELESIVPGYHDNKYIYFYPFEENGRFGIWMDDLPKNEYSTFICKNTFYPEDDSFEENLFELPIILRCEYR